VAKKMRVELNSAGVRALLKDPAVAADIAERAARIQEMLLEGIEAKMAAMTDPMEREAMLRADMNKIISDAMDRALGKPVQQVDQTSSDGTMTPAVIRIVPVAPGQDGS